MIICQQVWYRGAAASLFASVLLGCLSSCTDEVAGPLPPAPGSSASATQPVLAGNTVLRLPAPRSLAKRPPAPHSHLSPRGTSAVNEAGLLRGGDDFDVAVSANLITDGGLGDFSPAGSGALTDLAYGLYRFDALDYDRTGLLRLRWNSPPVTDQLWLAVGNFSTDRWDWFRPANRNQVSIDETSSISSYVSPSGEMLVVVLLTGSTGASLDAMRLGDPLMTADFRNTAGAGHFTVWAPTSGLSYKSTSSIATGSIVNFEWDLDGDGDYETDTDMVDEVLNASLDLGLTNVGLRITSDWGTQVSSSHAMRGLSGNWNLYTLTDSLNDAQHTTSVRTPMLLGSRADSGEYPLILWSESTVDSTNAPPQIRRSVRGLLGDDPTLESWSPAADAVTDEPAMPINYILQDVARLSGGECGLVFSGDDPGDTNLYFTRSTDASAGGWETYIAIGAGVDSEGGATLEVFNGDLFCAYNHGGTTDLRKNTGTNSAAWEAAVNIDQPNATRYAYYKPALAMGIQWPTLDQQLYCCAESLNTTAFSTQPVYYNSDPAGSSFLYQHTLDSTNPSGQSMTGASYRSVNYPGSLRSIFAYKQAFTGDLRYIHDDPTDLFTGQLSDGISLGLPPLSLGELHLAGAEDNINNLADVFLVCSIAGGGLFGFEYLEDLGWYEPGPDSGSSSIEPTDPGDAGSQPCCAWIQGRPAVVYVDYATQNIKFAVLN